MLCISISINHLNALKSSVEISLGDERMEEGTRRSNLNTCKRIAHRIEREEATETREEKRNKFYLLLHFGRWRQRDLGHDCFSFLFVRLKRKMYQSKAGKMKLSMILNSNLNVIPVEVRTNINDPSLDFMVNFFPFFCLRSTRDSIIMRFTVKERSKRLKTLRGMKMFIMCGWRKEEKGQKEASKQEVERWVNRK